MWLADKLGTREEEYELKEGCVIRDLLEKIVEQRADHARRLIERLLQGSLDIIILQNSKTPSNGLNTPLNDGDEVSLLPPVSGGASINTEKLVRESSEEYQINSSHLLSH
jgi:molybdopterin synthase catalytic subunit/molybdopterin synthase sulfur carrier subunit